jgi:hypothetical protein
MSGLKKAIAFRIKSNKIKLMGKNGIKKERPFCERFGLKYTTYRAQERGEITLDFIEEFCFKTKSSILYILCGIGEPFID